MNIVAVSVARACFQCKGCILVAPANFERDLISVDYWDSVIQHGLSQDVVGLRKEIIDLLNL